MVNILTTNEFIITQDSRKKTLFEIKCINNSNNSNIINNTNNHFQYILRSLTKTKIIKNYTILDDCNSIILNACSIKSYEEFKREERNLNKTNKLSYLHLLKMAYYLSKQLSYLIKNESKCFYTYDAKNIIVIDNNIFIYLSQEHLKEVKNDNIYIYSPISKSNNYLSPELSNIKTLPIIINYKTIFYSLGLLLIESIQSEEETEEQTEEKKINVILYNKLNTFKETKLYYFLERCLKTFPNERYLLYI
jgi:hypothetical protein